jgi:hypothetical protein
VSDQVSQPFTGFYYPHPPPHPSFPMTVTEAKLVRQKIQHVWYTSRSSLRRRSKNKHRPHVGVNCRLQSDSTCVYTCGPRRHLATEANKLQTRASIWPLHVYSSFADKQYKRLVGSQ